MPKHQRRSMMHNSEIVRSISNVHDEKRWKDYILTVSEKMSGDLHSIQVFCYHLRIEALHAKFHCTQTSRILFHENVCNEI